MAEKTPSGEDVSGLVRQLLEKGDGDGLSELLGPMPLSQALREFVDLTPAERDVALMLVPPALAAELIEEAPSELAADLVERLEPDGAALIIGELDSDVQADVIGEMDSADAEAILAEMNPADAADVRRLVEYDTDVAGGLMAAEAFTFRETDSVGAVLRRLVSDEEDFERYRGQHPYVLDANQCPVAVTMRELSLGLVRPIDAAKVWAKEAIVGTINGIALGVLIGVVAWVWKDNAFLGIVIGTALAINTLVAVSIGGVIPLLVKRLGQDPAVASGPLLTTITDMAGFFLVLSLATALMPKLG